MALTQERRPQSTCQKQCPPPSRSCDSELRHSLDTALGGCMSRARCVSPQNQLNLPRGVKTRLSRNETSFPHSQQGAFDAQPLLLRRNLTEQSSENVCEDMYTPVSTMDCEQYQDLSRLSWFDSAAQPWAAGEAPLTAITPTATDEYGLMQAQDSNNNLYEENDYKIKDMDNLLYKMSPGDEIKTLAVTAPMEVVPMRLRETFAVRGIVKTEDDDFDVGREEEINMDSPYSASLSLSQEIKEEHDLLKVDTDFLLMDAPDLLDELGNRDLIDFITSDELPQPVVPSTETEVLHCPTPNPILPSSLVNDPPGEPSSPLPKATPKLKSTYLAIPRQFTSGNGDDKKIPKMLILKTPQTSDLSNSNFRDFSTNDFGPGMSIGERVKTVGKRHRTISSFTEEDDSADESSASSSRKARRMSTVSISSASTDKYRELRDKNNEASRKSRQNRKQKEKELKMTLDGAERKNRALRAKSDELEKLVHSLRKILLQIVINSNKR